MIEIANLSYEADGRKILKDLTLTVETGECMALLGLNGAGKSSLIDILTGMIPARKGTTMINGKPFEQVRGDVGVLFEYTPYFYYVTVDEWLRYLCAIHRVDYAAAQDGMQMLEIEHLRKKQLQKLSKGERRKVSIICSLMHSPSVLILDEPTPDLDPFIREAVWRQFKAVPRTILFTTHLWDEASTYADKVAFIARGRILAMGTSEEFLSSKYLPERRKITFSRESMKAEYLQGVYHIIENDMVNIYHDDLEYLTSFLTRHSVPHSVTDTGLKDVYLILNDRSEAI